MVDRLQPPPFQGLPSFVLPAAHHLNLAQGFSLTGITGVQQEVIKIDWVYDAGRWRESVPGGSHFVSLLLDKGTRTRSAAEVAARLEGLGAHLEISAGADFFFVSLYALVKNWPAALSIVTDVLENAIFPENEVALQKTIMLENLRVNKEKTGYLAGQAIRAAVFGDLHPYGRSLEEQHVQAILSSHLQEFHRNFRLLRVFATAPKMSHLEHLAEALGARPGPQPAAMPAYAVQPGLLRQQIFKAGSVQHSIRLGKRVIGRAHADYPALLLVNHLLGGFFGSRLMKNIREKKGLTYGIHATVQPYLHDTLWTISADVNTANLVVALAEIHHEVGQLCETEVSHDELMVCKNHFLGTLVADVATPFSVMEKIHTVYLNDLAHNHYEKLFRVIQTLTPAQFRAIATRYLGGDWHQVTVG